jgi:hypothetical protein
MGCAGAGRGVPPPGHAKATFGSTPRFHEIEVKVKRPGVKVPTRKGFYGVTDEQVAAAAATP